MRDPEVPHDGLGTGVRLWLVRHGETEWSRDGRHTGRTDIPLTERGERQADALRPTLEDVAFRAVLCSPLGRARDTLARARPGTAPDALLDDLQEWDYGDAEGRTTPQMREDVPEWTVWTHHAGGESADDVGARADRAIEAALERGGEAEADDPPRDVLLVAHGHLLRILVARWLGLAAGEGARFVLDPATMSVLGHERERRVLRRWNVRP